MVEPVNQEEAIVVDTDSDFPRDLPSTANLQRLRERRERERTRSESRAKRKKRSKYVLPLRLLCLFIFSCILLRKLDRDETNPTSFSWAIVFIPLWIENLDKMINNAFNIQQAYLEGRLDREVRYDMLLPPIAKMILDFGSFITKIFLAARLDMDLLPYYQNLNTSISFTPSSSSSSSYLHNNSHHLLFPSSSPTIPLTPYRQVFLPFWICAGISTFVICWTPDRPEVRNADDTCCQKFWRQITTAAVYGGSAVLLPLLIVNKVDQVASNTSWTMVLLPIWAVLVLAGVIGFLVLPIYAICVLADSLPTDALRTRSERASAARLLFAFAYCISSTVLTLSLFLFNVTLRLEYENQEFWINNAKLGINTDSGNITRTGTTSTSPSSFTATPSLSPSPNTPSSLSPSSSTNYINNVTNAEICWPLIVGFANLFICVCFIRFGMIRRRIMDRQRARAEFEAEAFDTQQGGVEYSSVSNQFESIKHPILLFGSESTLIFKLFKSVSDIGNEMSHELETVGIFHDAATTERAIVKLTDDTNKTMQNSYTSGVTVNETKHTIVNIEGEKVIKENKFGLTKIAHKNTVNDFDQKEEQKEEKQLVNVTEMKEEAKEEAK
jgi:hypothetical protein